MPETRDVRQSKRAANGCLDKFLLFGAALLVCILGVSAFWVAEVYQINPAWVFFLWNSVFMVPMFMKDFRSHLRKPAFVTFLVVWAIMHGLLVVALMRRTPVVVWVLAISVEFFLGYSIADQIFGISRATNETTE